MSHLLVQSDYKDQEMIAGFKRVQDNDVTFERRIGARLDKLERNTSFAFELLRSFSEGPPFRESGFKSGAT